MTEQPIYRHLRAYADHLRPELPMSPHVEISNGQILLTMSPAGAHGLNAKRVTTQLDHQLQDGLIAYMADIEHPGAAKLRRPDVVVVDEDAMDVPGAVDATAVRLAVEIVSPSNPENDYEGKLRDYPVMGIPHYLIIDPRDGTAHHHWKIATEDGPGRYSAHVPYVFGDKITVGDWVIDTGELRRYPESK
ncbi:Uma2 family endonuclease [Streptacidiphilus sp. N1-10]|uniref:Uma2 family endonuclease n=1 Tax=Streptacidiphilus jeojiensis TaxID=3229225 RepID=A0ABV6XYZ1_9ACTN